MSGLRKMMLIDNYQRQINYLRISITDMCNLRCFYCQPKPEMGWKTHREILRYEEIIRLASLMVQSGIKHIRVTGGEPLIKKDVLLLIEGLAKIEGLTELALTTNGTKLVQFARQLKENRVDRINISMDSLNKDRYSKITGGGRLNDVLAGIDEALRVGLVPLKINMVVMAGINDDEIESFAMLTLDKPVVVRFIEFMPISWQGISWDERYLPTHILKQRLSQKFSMIPENSIQGNGTAEYYKIGGSPSGNDAAGSIGFISSISKHFCDRCNRLRLTSDGHLRLCLGQDMEINLKQPMRDGASDKELKELILQGIRNKPIGHQFQVKRPEGRQMCAIGG
ncbi:GTP 3',8-cyclase MoaA [Candidatus Desantisbacteria bacterium]|nr:GTP 3',8-cyclase MoaA [Candidatus Desantisbacteria bacterium]